MSQKDTLEFSASVPVKDAVRYLESLAKALRDSEFLLESGDRSLPFEVGTTIKIKLEAASDPIKGKSSIDLRLSWRAPEEEEMAAPPSLVIVPGKPAVAAGVEED